ncbi:FAD/NAD(P)-binding domain-containing protein [Hesseltinella vesiculosa]|uniref:FAD/NAD(P)-binding domain-containing protein n=1 Tax=Hesseltinella vesiculosa TaxID=101127 RepID=A0A1X2G7T5_9FUNG|nr:FAD/NAD(P)-binding domain-containing protein [Hesseltinella vesiculosa]
MHSRMIHVGQEGMQTSQPYSVHGEHINAVDRATLNELLLDAAEEWSNVTIYFEHQLSQANFELGSMEFFQGPKKTKITKYADLIVGADGAYSKVRNQMMRRMRLNYEQEYIDTGYCEMYMAPKVVNGQPVFALDPNHLHIWPRHTFMFIALPNPDKTFTCTLFMPFDMFDTIDTEAKLLAFFNEHFADAVPLLGKDRLVADYFGNPRGSLISIKTSPHHLDDKCVIVGDAAHAMVPFYGQGMNCGFQDIEVLHRVLDSRHVRPVLSKDGSHVPGLKEALAAYTEEHVPNAHAICDLAMYNYYEMRSAVTSKRYLARKKIEGWIHLVLPQVITPLYTMVSFSTMPYAQAVQRWHRQTFWLNVGLGAMTAVTAGVTLWATCRLAAGHCRSEPLLLATAAASTTLGAASSTDGKTMQDLAKTAARSTVDTAKSLGALGISIGSSLGITSLGVDRLSANAVDYLSQWWK